MMRRQWLSLTLIVFLLIFVPTAERHGNGRVALLNIAIASGENESQSSSFGSALLTELGRITENIQHAVTGADDEQADIPSVSENSEEVTNVGTSELPVLKVKDESEMIAAIQQMKAQNAAHFQLLLNPDLYKLVRGDADEYRFIRLQGGLYGYKQSFYSDGTHKLEFEGCIYWDGSIQKVTGETQFLEAIQRFGESGLDEFAVMVDPKTFDRLNNGDLTRLDALQTAAFLNSGATTYDSNDEHVMIYRKEGKSPFYPGYTILRAVRLGRENMLPLRLRETLAKARQMVSGINGSPEEMELAIHDLLCRHIRYVIDDSTDEDDCCIGAILNGEANCDGYSDAFLLLCGLKGIPVILITGEAREMKNPEDDASHMWNLVFVNGLWRGVDVTWDDHDEQDDIDYHQYNMGMDRMKENYQFIEDFLPSDILPVTDLQNLPIPEYIVFSAEEVTGILRECGSTGQSKVILWLGSDLYHQFISEENPVWRWIDLAGISGDVSYSNEEQRVTISNIRVLSSDEMVGQANTEEEVISLMRVASGKRELRVYCSEGLFELYRSPNNPVWKWMDFAGISTEDVSYSDPEKKIIISNIKILDSDIMVGKANTEEEIISLMRSASGKKELWVYCSDELFDRFNSPDNPVWKWLKRAGISGSVSYQDPGNKILISDIEIIR